MRKYLVVSVLVLLVGLLPVLAAEQSVVFIDLDRAFNEFYKTKLADTQLKQQADEFNGERKTMTADYEKKQKEFGDIRDEAQNTALSDDVRTEKRNLAEEKLVELRDYESRIRRFDDSRRKQLDDQSRRMRKRIVEEIQQVVKDYAQTQGYQAVIDSSGQSLNGVEIILYTDSKIEITDTILGLLNKGKEEEKPAAKSK
jgi:outer membrane protein